MDHLDGSSLESGSALLAAAEINANWTKGAERGMSGRTRLVLEILMALMCFGAVTGNILVIIIVAATKTFHSVTSVLIMNLAVSDLLVGVGVMPFVALSVINHDWVDYTDLCLYVGYTSSVYCTASVLTLAAIALDRYHSIMDCLRYDSRCTVWRTCGVVLWIWLQALATSCPPLLGWSSVSYVAPMYSCAVNWASSPSYTAFMAALSYLIPAVVIFFCYVKIVKVARSHARRIHTLEDSVQRSMSPSSCASPGDSSRRRCEGLHNPSRLVYHVSAQFVSEVSTDDRSYISRAFPGATSAQGNTSSRRLFSFLAQGTTQQTLQNSQQHHNHGVVRLFLIITAFFFCWTPYIGVALVQAFVSQPSLVPSSAVTFSYWLVLLNSDINPLLYALLSKRFQSALCGLRQKIRSRLGSMVGRGARVRPEGDECRGSDPFTATTVHPSPPSSSESLTCDRCSSSIFTVCSDFRRHPGDHLCKVCHPENVSPSSVEQNAGGERRVDWLQVPSRPQEGNRLPFSAITEERQATFFYGQITVRVEHDVC
ncbi:5-hydroxytryptamine receptor 1D [Mugil cephalus]|uniref:5-hydroxytryptamine receptor 1D n=1 Tax=Mugil cephalus TaxID=48193 RepID=UPI001FB63D21|nr:5-hydroxytryptamine receptor 1D [Mugil cephalus]